MSVYAARRWRVKPPAAWLGEHVSFAATLTLAHGRFPVSEDGCLFAMVGVCGGFTTTSFSPQTLDLLESGALARAGINILASVALCVCAVALGHFMAAYLNGDAPEIAQGTTEEEAGLQLRPCEDEREVERKRQGRITIDVMRPATITLALPE